MCRSETAENRAHLPRSSQLAGQGGAHGPQKDLGAHRLAATPGPTGHRQGCGTDCTPLPTRADGRDMDIRGLLWRLGRGHPDRMLAPPGRGTQSRPAPSQVFILYLLGTREKGPCLDGTPAAPLPLLPGLSTSSSPLLGRCDSRGSEHSRGARCRQGRGERGPWERPGARRGCPGLPSAHHFR